MAKAKRSKRLVVYDPEKIKLINSETKKLLKAYEKDMSLRELSPGTIAGYIGDLNQWLIYVLENQDNRSVLELDEDDLTDFFYYCKSEGNNTRRMRRRYSSVSAFYKFLRKKKKIIENPMDYIDRPIRDNDVVEQTYLTEEQIIDLKKKWAATGNLTKELYFLLSLSTMARVNAIAHLRWEQLSLSDRTFTNVLEKEGKLVTLFFSEECKQKLINLKHFRDTNFIDDGGWVFPGKSKDGKIQPISNGTLHSYAAAYGLHCHDFRHSQATLLKNRGMPIEDISTLLNHSSLDVTRSFYIKMDEKGLRDIKDQYEI